MPNPQPGQMVTDAMIKAGRERAVAYCVRIEDFMLRAIYTAMHAARPTPDGEIGELVGEWRVLTETLSGRSFLQVGDDLCTALETQAADIARLREALKPFADEAREYCFEMDCSPLTEAVDAWADAEPLADTPTKFNCGDLRRARDVYDAQ